MLYINNIIYFYYSNNPNPNIHDINDDENVNANVMQCIVILIIKDVLCFCYNNIKSNKNVVF